jgi:hypothetical protein
MRPHRIVATDSFKALEMSSDDIPTSMYNESGSFYHFPIKMGNGDWAMLIVPSRTVESRDEYFKQIIVKQE